MTNYPAQIDTSISLPSAVDNLTPVTGSVVNRLRDAILAIETELGVKPSGIYTTARERLDTLEGKLNGLQIISLTGDLGGTLISPKVVGIQGRPVSTVAPALNNVLLWNGIAWMPAAVPSGGGGGVAFGDLFGAYPGPITVTGLQGNAVKPGTLGAANDGYILTWTNANHDWEAKAPPVSFTAGGDLVGTNTSQNLISITKLNVVTLEKYGAVGDGITDDSAAMLLALAAVSGGGTIQLGSNKTYLVTASAPYSVPANVSIIGFGDSSIIKTGKDNAVFIPGEHTSFLNFKILGTGALFTSQIGIANQNLGAPAFSSAHFMRVDGMTFDSLGAAGILTYQGNIPAPYFNALISNCRFFQCGRGLWLLDEYSTATGIQIDSCGTGIECEGGNQVFVGGTITNCTIGFLLDGGGNDAHGVVSGMEINHNVTNIKAYLNVANGEKFVDCMIYSGDILLQSTHGIQFIGCQIDVNNYYFDGSIGTVFDNCTFPQSAGTNTIHNNFNGNASTTRWASNNVDLNGNYPAFIVAGYDGTLWNHNFDGYILASTLASQGLGYAAVDNTGRLLFSNFPVINTTGFAPFTTANTTFTNAATFVFDPTTIQSGTLRKIKLRIVAETTGPAFTAQLYNFTAAAVVPGSTLGTTNTSATELVTGDLTSVLTNGKAIYQVQIEMAAGGGVSDQITLDFARLEVTYT